MFVSFAVGVNFTAAFIKRTKELESVERLFDFCFNPFPDKNFPATTETHDTQIVGLSLTLMTPRAYKAIARAALNRLVHDIFTTSADEFLVHGRRVYYVFHFEDDVLSKGLILILNLLSLLHGLGQINLDNEVFALFWLTRSNRFYLPCEFFCHFDKEVF